MFRVAEMSAAVRRSVRWWWLGGGGLLALLVAALVTWWLKTHTRIELTVPLPPQGEAAYNPLYLLQQSLRADGVLVQSRPHLQLARIPLQPEDTVVLYGDPQQLSATEAERLLEWVHSGGHLVARLPEDIPGILFQDQQMGDMLDALGVVPPILQRRPCHDVQIDGPILRALQCAGQRFTLAPGHAPEQAWGGEDSGYSYARLAWGRGSVDIFVRLDILDNAELARAGHAAWARQLLAPNYARGTVHLIYDTHRPALWQLIVNKGRMAWIPLLLALVAWLWLRMPRFGPLHPTPAPARRALLEHVEASGEHLYRYRRSEVLLRALHAAFERWLHRHDPLAASLDGEARIVAIAARTGVLASEVADALDTASHPPNTAGFRRRAGTLVRMMRRGG